MYNIIEAQFLIFDKFNFIYVLYLNYSMLDGIRNTLIYFQN